VRSCPAGLFISLISFLLIPAIVDPVAAEEADVDSLLTSMSEAVAGMKAVKGTFKQQVEMTLMGESKSYTGRVFYKHPDLLRLEYDEPEGQLLVCDGTSYWMYLTDQKRPQVFRTPADEGMAGFLSYSTLRVLLDGYRAVFNDEEEIDGTPCYKIYFTAEKRDIITRFVNLSVWVGKDDLMSRRFSYEDIAGNLITYNFYKWMQVDFLSADLFSFTPPEGADIFESLIDK
jgi:outer membrane lipoprotein-sorting protein